MKIVFNSSPLIFLSRLDFLKLFLQYDYQFYVPEVVIKEINAKQDRVSNYQQLLKIKFRVKRSIFEAIFTD